MSAALIVCGASNQTRAASSSSLHRLLQYPIIFLCSPYIYCCDVAGCLVARKAAAWLPSSISARGAGTPEPSAFSQLTTLAPASNGRLNKRYYSYKNKSTRPGGTGESSASSALMSRGHTTESARRNSSREWKREAYRRSCYADPWVTWWVLLVTPHFTE
jgi:hypothetical protein